MSEYRIGSVAPNRSYLAGKRFGRLLVIKYSHTDGKLAYWECVCDCGNTAYVGSYHLTSRSNKTCGGKGCKSTGEYNGMLGKKHSPEAIQKMSAAAFKRDHSHLRGANNHNWNPDRADVVERKKYIMAYHRLLHRTLQETKTVKSEDMLGYSKEQLRDHLAEQFVEGMTWLNHGEWHIDHIKPIRAFLDEGITDSKIINSLNNLQPLWAFDNLSKGSRYNPYSIVRVEKRQVYCGVR